MQLSHREPAVMHAIIAVGSLHQVRSGLIGGHTDGYGYHTRHRFALLQYSKAIALLRQDIENGQTSTTADVVLLVCLLFVGFELLQGNVGVAMSHLNNGLGIITERHAKSLVCYATYKGNGAQNPAADQLIDELVPAFTRLDYVSVNLHTNEPPKLTTALQRLPRCSDNAIQC